MPTRLESDLLDLQQRTWAVIDRLASDPEQLQANWCLPPQAARFLYLLTRIANARQTVEVGTSIGFSTLHLALGVALNDPEHGRVITIDASPERQAEASQHLREAGLEQYVEFREGQALDVLRHPNMEASTGIDLAFLDARKSEYLTYAQLLTHQIKEGGIILADNTQSHRGEMQNFVTAMQSGPSSEWPWESCDIDTPNGFILARKQHFPSSGS